MSKNNIVDNKYARDSALKREPAISDPANLLKKSIPKMTNGNWRDEFAAVEAVRKVVVQQAQLITPHLTAIVKALVTQCDNLRSSIVKATLLCLAVSAALLGLFPPDPAAATP